MSLNILIISKNNIINYNKNINFIKINNLYGNFEIYKNHTSLFSYLKKCNIYIYKKKIYNIYIHKGFLECIYDKITIVNSYKDFKFKN